MYTVHAAIKNLTKPATQTFFFVKRLGFPAKKSGEKIAAIAITVRERQMTPKTYYREQKKGYNPLFPSFFHFRE